MNIDEIKMKAIIENLVKLALIFPTNIEVNEASAMIWYEILEDQTIDNINYGFKQVRKTCKAFPTPAHIIEAIDNKSIDNAPTSEQAIQEILDKTGSLSVYDNQKIEYSHPAIKKAVSKIGGYRSFIEANEFELKGLKAKFKQAYSNILSSGNFEDDKQTYQLTPKILPIFSNENLINFRSI